jgi:arylsulfatase A-like enzyme
MSNKITFTDNYSLRDQIKAEVKKGTPIMEIVDEMADATSNLLEDIFKEIELEAKADEKVKKIAAAADAKESFVDAYFDYLDALGVGSPSDRNDKEFRQKFIDTLDEVEKLFSLMNPPSDAAEQEKAKKEKKLTPHERWAAKADKGTPSEKEEHRKKVYKKYCGGNHDSDLDTLYSLLKSLD